MMGALFILLFAGVTEVDSLFLPRVTDVRAYIMCMGPQGNTPLAAITFEDGIGTAKITEQPEQYSCAVLRVFLNGEGEGWENAQGTVDVPLLSPVVVDPGAELLIEYDDPNLVLQAILYNVRKLAQPAIIRLTAVAQEPLRLCSDTWPDCPNRTSEIVDDDGAVWTLLPVIGGAATQTGIARNGVRVANSVDFVTIIDGVIFMSDFLSGSGWAKWSNDAFVPTEAP